MIRTGNSANRSQDSALYLVGDSTSTSEKTTSFGRSEASRADMAVPSADAVYGHWARHESLACTGCHGRFSVYALEPSKVVVLDADGARDSHGSSLGSQSVHPLEQPCVEVISCVTLHPHEDVLCVGTTNHGLYVTRASAPEFSSRTRLPFSVSGECVFSACVMQLSPTATVLVFSSTFREKKGSLPHRLSLWHLDDNQLLWRGAMEPLSSLCALTVEGTFAACAGSRLYLFTAQASKSATDEASSPSAVGQTGSASRPRVVVLSRQCTSVPQLDGVEYVQCLCAPTAEDGSGFYALTTSGYLVAFDITTGAVSRWMDCKVCPATGMRLWDNNLVLTGSLVRFFRADNWKFCGKLRPTSPEAAPSSSPLEAILGDGLVSTFVPVHDGSLLLFFSRTGGYSLYRCDRDDADGDGHIHAQHLGHFTPMLLLPKSAHDTQSPSSSHAQWLVAERDAHTPPRLLTAAVWTRNAIAALVPQTRTAISLHERTSCAAYHAGTHCVLAFMTAEERWMAFDLSARVDSETAALGAESALWTPCGNLRWSREADGEPLYVAASATSGDVAVLSSGNTVTHLTCTRTMSTSASVSAASAVTMRRGRVSRARCEAPLFKLMYVADRLYGVTPQSIVFLGRAGNTNHPADVGEKEFPISEGIVDACGAYRDVVVIHSRGAYLYRTDRTGRCAALSVPDAVSLGRLPLRTCVYEPVTDCVALANDAQVLLYRSQSQGCPLLQRVSLQAVPERLPAADVAWPSSIRAVGLQAGAGDGQMTVYVLNSLGQAVRYDTVVGPASPSLTPPCAPGDDRTGEKSKLYKPSAARLLPPRGAGAEENSPAGRPPLRTTSHTDPTTANRRARRSTSAAAPTSGELQNRFDELNGFYEQQKQLDALTPRAGRRASVRQPTSSSAAAATLSARSASAPLRGSRLARPARPPAQEVGADTPSPSSSPPRPEPFAVSGAAAARASSLSAVEVSAMSNPSAVVTHVAGRTEADSAALDTAGDLSAPNIPLPDEDWAIAGDTAAQRAWQSDAIRARLTPNKDTASHSRAVPRVPVFGYEQDASAGSDVSTAATTFSIRTRTLRQSLVDLQELLDEGQILDEMNTSDDIDALTQLLTSVAASLQTLHHQAR